MTGTAHPMLEEDRPLIPTRPMDRLSSAVSVAIEAGHKGISVDGDGRVGKTRGARMLSIHQEWRPYPMVFAEMNYSNPTKPTEAYFFNWCLSSVDLKTIKQAPGPEVLARTRNYLLSLTGVNKERIIVLIINEANRFTTEEYKHLVSLDNDLEQRHKRLFLVLVNQRDADEGGVQAIDKRPPAHILGRFLLARHHYTGLLWDKPEDEANNGLDDDVTMALMEYDVGPSGIPCSQYFAPAAHASGWRLVQQLPLFRMEVEELRSQHGLPRVAPWPMKTFECFVYFLLVRIAGEDRHFKEFTKEQVRMALRWSAYIELELSRYPDKKS